MRCVSLRPDSRAPERSHGGSGWVIAAMVTLAHAGCGDMVGGDGAGVGDGGVEVGAEAGGRVRFTPDSASASNSTVDAANDALDQTQSFELPRAEVSGDAGAIDTGGQPQGCDFPSNPQTGQPGAPCNSAGDCDSGYCIEGPGGKVCTKTCTDCCPTGFACEAASSVDPQFVCIAKLAALCRPCDSDGECAKSAGALCVSYGDSGRFCGGSCVTSDDCYSGYECKQADGTAGSGLQCVKVGGECACTTAYVLAGAKTSCVHKNDIGACKGVRKCVQGGLSACDAPVPATETCNGKDDDCDGKTDEPGAGGCQQFFLDADKDGAGDLKDAGVCLCSASDTHTALTAVDCDDAKADVKPGQAEACNGLDDDCDGDIDAGFPDTDGDGAADCVDPDIDNDGAANAADCAPANAAISPAATETCNNFDDNCNGAVDEAGAQGCKALYADGDGDGFGKAFGEDDKGTCLCKPVGVLKALKAGDCNDNSVDINPDASEVCNDKDDNCDGNTDEGCDDDQDGWCDAKMVVVGAPLVCGQGVKDCDDLNAALSPGNKEICGNTVDDNCDGETDAGVDAKECLTLFADADKDGFGAGLAKCLCAAEGIYTASNNKDCNDKDALQSPAKPEVCGNGLDDNCSGVQDEEDAQGCVPYYSDPDGDGYGASDQACLCGPSQTYVTAKGGDCKPQDPEISPGAVEICNGIDDDCKNGADEAGAKGCVTYYADKDGDGIGDTALSKCLCKPAAPYTATAKGDCDDTKVEAKPGAAEVCDGFDNDCNGKIDEQGSDGCKIFFIDKDGDKFGAAASAACLCALEGEYNVAKGGDCDDTDKAIYPGAIEFCDGIDNNCNNNVDEENAIGCIKYLKDSDKDGFGASGVSKCLCKSAYPYTADQGGDCNDDVATIKPNALETCDAIDNNCDGATDPAGSDGCAQFFIDKDKDGYGSMLAASKCQCEPSTTYSASISGDCNDNDPAAFPKAAEFCDGKDTDCDGIADPKNAQGCKPYFMDLDSDGYGANTLSFCQCGPDAPFTTTKAGDCNDTNASLHPGAAEQCNGVDDDCNGKTDDGAAGGKDYWMDQDGDGFGVGIPVQSCGKKAPFTAIQAGDCNDNAKGIYPWAPEIQCNGVDEDCSGADLCTCQAVKESFDSGSGGWSLGGGWSVAGWSQHGGGMGLGYGDGSNKYGQATTSASSASKALAIPSTATKLVFWYRYSPDPSEYGGFDAFTINFGGIGLVSWTAGNKGSTAWTQVIYPLPAGWAGTTKTFTVTFNCIDGAYNNGWGAAVDDIEIACN